MSVVQSPLYDFLLGEKRTFANKGCFLKGMKEKCSSILKKLPGEME
jgi:hypothetical protein